MSIFQQKCKLLIALFLFFYSTAQAQSSPQEMNNLAYDFEKNKDLIWAMNLKLNSLIEREIGKDDGSFLPLTDWINWNGVRKSMVNL